MNGSVLDTPCAGIHSLPESPFFERHPSGHASGPGGVEDWVGEKGRIQERNADRIRVFTFYTIDHDWF
ncbi:hypothetical protein Metfor_1395 [Methanoregula formicica SMSP]|uniref:Uncharacterized protein n=1 Tax=Methanoregula formicica (strain DSM 22288 / NBRC 105244 / SMSP) TaxID=593750 RepID=L0HGI0_METFS|nr:hypothetical protein Metfor_1395 [Methanoregula formicica SMSP]